MSPSDRSAQALRADPTPDWEPRHYTLSPELVSVLAKDLRATTAMETLANQIIAQVVESGRRGLAFCGASKGVGVTFMAGNIAAALSQAGISTLLIDGNLRDPGVQRLFAPDVALPGLGEYLSNPELTLNDVVQYDVLPNLAVMFAGKPAPEAADLIGGDRFRDLVMLCQREFTLTIIDTPAANRWADARGIARLATYAMLVARRNVSFVSDVATLAGELSEDGVVLLGKIMNAA